MIIKMDGMAMEISFVSSVKDSNNDAKGSNKDSNKPYTIHIYSENSSVLLVMKQTISLKNVLNLSWKNIK